MVRDQMWLAALRRVTGPARSEESKSEEHLQLIFPENRANWVTAYPFA
jgi:hypothetical protein